MGKSGVTPNKDLVKYADVGMTYYFNEKYVHPRDGKINLLDEDDDFYASNALQPMIS